MLGLTKTLEQYYNCTPYVQKLSRNIKKKILERQISRVENYHVQGGGDRGRKANNGINSKHCRTKVKEFEDIKIAPIQNEIKRKNFFNKHSISDLRDNIKWPITCVTGVTKGGARKKHVLNK